MNKSQDSTEYRLTAVIDVGSTSIRMVIAQINEDGSYSALDTLHQSVAVGSDTFTLGRISRAATEECVKVLQSFASVMKEYGLDLHREAQFIAGNL